MKKDEKMVRNILLRHTIDLVTDAKYVDIITDKGELLYSKEIPRGQMYFYETEYGKFSIGIFDGSEVAYVFRRKVHADLVITDKHHKRLFRIFSSADNIGTEIEIGGRLRWDERTFANISGNVV